MQEMLTIAAPLGFTGPWDGTIPPGDANTLFRMHTFSSASDIRDKGPNAIPVTPSNVTVGVDSRGSYMLFNGVNSVVAFASSLLDSNSFDLRFILGDLGYSPSALYDVTLIDGRPNVTNGRYLTVGYNKAKPFGSNLAFQSVGNYGQELVPDGQFPIVITIKVRPGKFEVVVNGKVIQTWAVSDTAFASQQWRIGRNAYSTSAQTPWLNGKVYYFDLKRV